MSKKTQHFNKTEKLSIRLLNEEAFGFGLCDIKICNNCNENNKSYSALGYSYDLSKGHAFLSDEANCYLAGSKHFIVSEI